MRYLWFVLFFTSFSSLSFTCHINDKSNDKITVKDHFIGSKDIVLGVITSARYDTQTKEYSYTMDVEEALKGIKLGEFSFVDESAGFYGPSLHAGKSYVLFFYGTDELTLCSYVFGGDIFETFFTMTKLRRLSENDNLVAQEKIKQFLSNVDKYL